MIQLCRVCANPFAIDAGGGDPAFTIAPDDAGDRCPQCRQLASRRIASAELERARAAIARELVEPYEDITIERIACGFSFIFTKGEQQCFADRQFLLPRRCTSCRNKRRAEQMDARFMAPDR